MSVARYQLGNIKDRGRRAARLSSRSHRSVAVSVSAADAAALSRYLQTLNDGNELAPFLGTYKP